MPVLGQTRPSTAAMLHYSPLWGRADTSCPSGSLYYTCAANNFSGCCTVNACQDSSGTCPDVSSSASSTKTTTHTSSTPTTTQAVGDPASTTEEPSTITKTVQVSSTPSSTSASSSSIPPTPTSTDAASTAGGNSSSGLSKGALSGVVVAGVLVFIVIAGLVCWKFWRRRKQLKEDQERPLASGRPGDEERQVGSGEKGHQLGLLSGSPDHGHGSPGGDNESLFGETSSGGIEAALARWGLHGARLAAMRKRGTVDSMRSRHDPADLGGSYMGQGDHKDKDGLGSQSAATDGLLHPDGSQAAELDGTPTIIAELETPDRTPKNSPSNASHTPSTFVSSWRHSGRTISTAMGTSPTITELDSTPRMSNSNSTSGDLRPVSGLSPSSSPGIPEADSETDVPAPLQVPGVSSWRYNRGQNKSSSSNDIAEGSNDIAEGSNDIAEGGNDSSSSNNNNTESNPGPAQDSASPRKGPSGQYITSWGSYQPQ